MTLKRGLGPGRSTLFLSAGLSTLTLTLTLTLMLTAARFLRAVRSQKSGLVGALIFNAVAAGLLRAAPSPDLA